MIVGGGGECIVVVIVCDAGVVIRSRVVEKVDSDGYCCLWKHCSRGLMVDSGVRGD